MEQPASADGDGHDPETLAGLLSAVDIFSPLAPGELSALAAGSTNHVYAPGETIIRAGDEGDSMFVVSRGSVDVRVDSNGTQRTINRLGEGAFFGEMALFTGEPRAANVVASEETEVLEIGHDAMKHLFDSNPDLLESLINTIASRQSLGDEPVSLMTTIKRIFGFD